MTGRQMRASATKDSGPEVDMGPVITREPSPFPFGDGWSGYLEVTAEINGGPKIRYRPAGRGLRERLPDSKSVPGTGGTAAMRVAREEISAGPLGRPSGRPGRGRWPSAETRVRETGLRSSRGAVGGVIQAPLNDG